MSLVVPALPFLRPESDAIRVVEANIHCRGAAPKGWLDSLDTWDPSTAVDISIKTEINPRQVFWDCGFDSHAVVRMVIVWSSSDTSLRGRGESRDFNLSNSSDEIETLSLSCVLEGSQLAGTLTVGVQLVLVDAGPSQFSLTPKLPGTLLWSDTRATRLEGAETRFPVEITDFAKLGWLPEGASWHVSWNTDDLHSMALGSVILQINESNLRIVEAVTQAQPVDEARLITEVIEFDVARSLIEGALSNEDFVNSPNQYEEGTLGETLRRLINSLFTGDSMRALAIRLREYPSLFDSELQARQLLFREGQ